jgi:hypothetical protein
MPQLGVMQVVGMTLRGAARRIERMVGVRERFVRGANRALRFSELALAVGKRRFSRFEIELPRRHLFGEDRIRL